MEQEDFQVGDRVRVTNHRLAGLYGVINEVSAGYEVGLYNLDAVREMLGGYPEGFDVFDHNELELVKLTEKFDPAEEQHEVERLVASKLTALDEDDVPDIVRKTSVRRKPSTQERASKLSGVSPRAAALDEAKELITGDRNHQYGPPTQDFARTAKLWTTQGFSFNGEPVEHKHVAMAMILLKMSRAAWQDKRDTVVDIAGYAGCLWECIDEDTKNG